MLGHLAALVRQNAGATALEYALIASIVVIALFAVERSIGEILNEFFINAGTELDKDRS